MPSRALSLSLSLLLSFIPNQNGKLPLSREKLASPPKIHSSGTLPVLAAPVAPLLERTPPPPLLLLLLVLVLVVARRFSILLDRLLMLQAHAEVSTLTPPVREGIENGGIGIVVAGHYGVLDLVRRHADLERFGGFRGRRCGFRFDIRLADARLGLIWGGAGSGGSGARGRGTFHLGVRLVGLLDTPVVGNGRPVVRSGRLLVAVGDDGVTPVPTIAAIAAAIVRLADGNARQHARQHQHRRARQDESVSAHDRPPHAGARLDGTHAVHVGIPAVLFPLSVAVDVIIVIVVVASQDGRTIEFDVDVFGGGKNVGLFGVDAVDFSADRSIGATRSAAGGGDRNVGVGEGRHGRCSSQCPLLSALCSLPFAPRRA
mmetsp:Transcript_53647/g.160616  ORF Transcript_53647/g.160616 Transcript_53647/m.160616 type:complete len:373 (+) Transcript_53647:257-1375(+)